MNDPQVTIDALRHDNEALFLKVQRIEKEHNELLMQQAAKRAMMDKDPCLFISNIASRHGIKYVLVMDEDIELNLPPTAKKPTEEQFERIKDAVVESLMDVFQDTIDECTSSVLEDDNE